MRQPALLCDALAVAAKITAPDLYGRKYCKMVLLRVDQCLRQRPATAGVIDKATVEHVLPQSSTDASWLAAFPDAAQRSELVDSLGNLLLLSGARNSSASNWDFNTKKVRYLSDGKSQQVLQSPFAITNSVLLEENKWTPEVIRRRTEDFWRCCGTRTAGIFE